MRTVEGIVFYRVQSGGALSEENLFLPAHLNAGVSSDKTVIRSITKINFLERLRSNPKFSQSLTSCLAERYAHALMLRELIGIKTAEDRLKKELESSSLSDRDREKKRSQLSTIESLLTSARETKEQTKGMEETMRSMIRQMAQEFVRSWKINKALYEQYGGQVVFQQAGVEPLTSIGIS